MTSLFPSPVGGDLLVDGAEDVTGSEKNGSDIPAVPDPGVPAPPPTGGAEPSSVNWANGPPKCGEWLLGAVEFEPPNGFKLNPGNAPACAPLVVLPVAAPPSPMVKNGEIASPPGRSTEGVMAPPVAAKCCQGDMIGRGGGGFGCVDSDGRSCAPPSPVSPGTSPSLCSPICASSPLDPGSCPGVSGIWTVDRCSVNEEPLHPSGGITGPCACRRFCFGVLCGLNRGAIVGGWLWEVREGWRGRSRSRIVKMKIRSEYW